MKVAIVGANSFLSQALLNKLCLDHEITQVYNERKNRLSNQFPQIHIQEFLKEKPTIDCIFYIASYISFEERIEEIDKIYTVNVGLLKRVSEAFQNSKIIHASSVAVYKNLERIITEKSQVHPKSSYGISKLWAEAIVENHIGGGVNVRISSLFGEGMNRGTFLPEIISNAVLKKQICLYGDGSRMQNYIYAEEVAEIMMKTMLVETSTPLLAVGSKSYSNKEIAYILKDLLSEVDIIFKGVDASSSFFYDNTLTNTMLNVLVSNSFEQQLKRTVLWMQKQY